MAFVNIQQWIEHPEQLDRNSLYELRTLINRYPYFQSLRLLYLKNLYILHDINFGGELRKNVLFIADRRKLFQEIEGPSYIFQTEKKEPSLTGILDDEAPIDRTLTLIDAFLAETPDESVTQTDFNYSSDYSVYLMKEEDYPTTDLEIAPKLRGHNLIDDFLENSDTKPFIRLKSADEYELEREHSQTLELGKEGEDQEDSSDEKIYVEEEEDDSCFTETLAKIYIKQHRYSKALEIIKKLSLKYPKKNAYFADQIRFIEKLIINAKSK